MSQEAAPALSKLALSLLKSALPPFSSNHFLSFTTQRVFAYTDVRSRQTISETTKGQDPVCFWSSPAGLLFLKPRQGLLISEGKRYSVSLGESSGGRSFGDSQFFWFFLFFIPYDMALPMGPHGTRHLAQQHPGTLQRIPEGKGAVEPVFSGHSDDDDNDDGNSIVIWPEKLDKQADDDQGLFAQGKIPHWLYHYMTKNRHAVQQYRRHLSDRVGPEACERMEATVYDEIITQMAPAGAVGGWSFFLANPGAEELVERLCNETSEMDSEEGEMESGLRVKINVLLELLGVPAIRPQPDDAPCSSSDPFLTEPFLKILNSFYESGESESISKAQRNFVCVRLIVCYYRVLRVECRFKIEEAYGAIEESVARSKCGSDKEIERQVRIVLKSFNHGFIVSLARKGFSLWDRALFVWRALSAWTRQLD